MAKTSFLRAPLIAAIASGQDTINITRSGGVFNGYAHFGPSVGLGTVIPGAPYSGELVSETVMTLADGTHLTSHWPSLKIYRDSHGRIREEREYFASDDKSDPLVIAQIYDEVAHFQYVLDPQGKVAHRLHMPESGPARTASPIAERISSPDFETLEPRTIEGVLAEGTRQTKTWPEDTFMENDRPVKTVTEQWISPELKVRLLSKSVDPRRGEQTTRLIHLSRAEPNGSLFEVPPGYAVVDEKSEFIVVWGSAAH